MKHKFKTTDFYTAAFMMYLEEAELLSSKKEGRRVMFEFGSDTADLRALHMDQVNGKVTVNLKKFLSAVRDVKGLIHDF